jgi:hypothetical protein
LASTTTTSWLVGTAPAVLVHSIIAIVLCGHKQEVVLHSSLQAPLCML